MSFNPSQIRAIHHDRGPALVLAGPGSGKTTVITNRIRWLTEEAGVDPGAILVITFTRAAAREMEQRYRKMTQTENRKVSFGTFHSVFFTILKLAYGYSSGSIVREEQRQGFLREMMNRLSIETEEPQEFVSGILGEISRVKGEQLELDHYYAKNCSEQVFKQLYRSYEQWLRSQGLLDFDDMLVMCYELFRQRADILQAWQRKYQYILIDEFQDINRIQYEIVKMLALPENNLFIVGDDDQSIYRFRGAKPEIMLGFERDYPDADKILLDVNYRSTCEILEAAGRVITHNSVRFPKEIQAARGHGRSVALQQWPDQRQEVKGIAEALRDYSRMGVDYEEIAVLYRTNLNPRLLVETLMEYNIPFHIRDQLPNLYEHWIARDLLAYLELAAGDRSRSLFLRIMNRPLRYISREAVNGAQVSLESLKNFYQDRQWMEERIERLEYDLKAIGQLSPQAGIRYICKAVGYNDYISQYAADRQLDPEELREILDQLQESAGNFSTLQEWKTYMVDYKQQLEEKGEDSRRERRGVSLMTMHSSKGLEFRVVYILDAAEGITPHHRAALPADLEEERRMFYVAMTRAKDRLHICYAQERFHKKQQLSRFVGEMKGETGT